MSDIIDLISELELSDDYEISSMAMKMRVKIGKYWAEDMELNPRMNKILYIAVVLDPRQKMNHVETCFKSIYGDARGEIMPHEPGNRHRWAPTRLEPLPPLLIRTPSKQHLGQSRCCCVVTAHALRLGPPLLRQNSQLFVRLLERSILAGHDQPAAQSSLLRCRARPPSP
ncbi:hypothetical protein AAHA92_06484 [Salvia divinorum]|uniref:hAT-like transposase RNase-H fold domain-containing protein n=1 Tax=Salvia divinorum TaxID=28513 RepID=A0ABD1I5U3_SALDI